VPCQLSFIHISMLCIYLHGFIIIFQKIHPIKKLKKERGLGAWARFEGPHAWAGFLGSMCLDSFFFKKKISCFMFG